MTQFKADTGGNPVSVTLNRISDSVFHATVDGRRYELQAIRAESGLYWVKLGEQSFDAVVMPSPEGYRVSYRNHRFLVEIEDPRAALRKAGQRGHEGVAEIKAPMPGKIVRVLVEEGAAVQAKQGIVVMEAMKMQNEIRSPKAGMLKQLLVRQGAAVNAGDLLCTVE